MPPPDGGDRFVVCNADEYEPGSCKDRYLMEDDPHQLLEGMIIAGHAMKANKGFIYVRGEFWLAYERMRDAIHEARAQGYLGEDLFGSGVNFDIELHRGAGAYICGEETALISSLEGKRGLPKLKPPFPAVKGVFGEPTIVNNVETLCNIAPIVRNGDVELASFFVNLDSECVCVRNAQCRQLVGREVSADAHRVARFVSIDGHCP
jgi:NADH-quinone oxidoreductase subunit F